MLVSIIICTYNRELYLPKCLEHLRNQNADPSQFEIVLVNNNSTDRTESICREFMADNPALNVVYALEKNPGLSFARNKGIETAAGDILCFIDDDGFAVPDYVAIVKRYAGDPAYKDYTAFGGKVIPVYNEGMEPGWLSSYIQGVVSKVDLGDQVKRFDEKYPAGCNMIFRREFFERHGGFNTDLHTRSDDKFIFIKLREAGLKVLYIPELVVEHFIDDYRLEKKFIKKLSKIVGQSEAIRLKDHPFSHKLMKFVEYCFKYCAALIISAGFVLTGEFSKARYLVLVRWNVIIGFFTTGKI